MAVLVDMKADGLRQMERADRLLDRSLASSTSVRPVHKSLQQLVKEGQTWTQMQNPWRPAGSLAAYGPRVLQGPQAQRLDRDVASFALSGIRDSGLQAAADFRSNLSARDFFALRHERSLLNSAEKSLQEAAQSSEQRSSERLDTDWEEAREEMRQGWGQAGLEPDPIRSTLLGPLTGGATGSTSPAVAPPQDSLILESLLNEPLSPQLVQRIAQLSCSSCPKYFEELAECWAIISQQLGNTPHAIISGSIENLQSRFREQLKAVVYRTSATRLGGIPDAWSLVRTYCRVKLDSPDFPNSAAHVWYAAYVASRAGLHQLVAELPDRTAPCSDRCGPGLRTVCSLMARRLDASQRRGGVPEPTLATGADSADLLRAGLAEDGNPFHEVLVSLLLGRIFAFGALPESCVEDWLWFRLHIVQLAAGDVAEDEAVLQQLQALRNQVLSLPPGHYDPIAGLEGPRGPVRDRPLDLLPPGATGLGLTGASTSQTLNFVKALLLTGQFGRVMGQLRTQDPALCGPAVHMALVLERAGSFEAMKAVEQPVSLASLLFDYSSRFSPGEQLRYFRMLNAAERAQAFQKLLLRGGVGTNNELLGFVDEQGRHRLGLLEQTLQEDGLGDRAEFEELCARAGRAAAERGKHREALRLLHLGKCYKEVLQVMCRCLRLPLQEGPSNGLVSDSSPLFQDVRHFFGIYERNLDEYAIAPRSWAITRRLFACRMFRELCARGYLEAAIDLFDREQLLPFPDWQGVQQVNETELISEYPRIIAAYVRILQHAAAQGAVAPAALQSRVRQLQSFMASHLNLPGLEQETVVGLAGLALYC